VKIRNHSSGPAIAGLAVVLAAALATAPARAQELEARTYANIPTGLNFLAFGYAYSDGNTFMDPSLPIEGLEAENQLLFAAYARAFSLLGRSAKVGVLIPVAFGDWEGTIEGEPVQQKRKAGGTGDARIYLSWNYIGAPALRPAEFAGYRQKTIVGTRLQIIAPTGHYDSNRLLNLGSNRWTFIPEIGVSHRLTRWTLELTGSAWLFTNNNEFLGSSTLSQRPLWTVTAHTIRHVRPGLWWAFGAGYGQGGRTEVDGTPRDTKQQNWRFAAVLAYRLRPSHGLRATLLHATTDDVGQKFDLLSLAYSFTWGRGMKPEGTP
jgi:hypothetical protein